MGRQVTVTAHRHQFARSWEPIEGLAEVFPDDPGDAIRGCDHPVERSVFRNPFDRGLRPDFADPRNVINRIAHQSQPVNDAIGRHAKALQNARGIHGLRGATVAGHGVDQHAVVAHKLGQILIAGRNDRTHPERLRLRREGTDHIVGFDPAHHQDRPTEGRDKFLQGINLPSKVFRHRSPVGLVLVIQIVPESRAWCIKDYGAETGPAMQLLVCPKSTQHRRHAVQRAGWFAPCVSKIGQRMECTIQIPRTIDQ